VFVAVYTTKPKTKIICFYFLLLTTTLIFLCFHAAPEIIKSAFSVTPLSFEASLLQNPNKHPHKPYTAAK